MAGVSGINGNISISGAMGGSIKSWNANFTRPTVDVTVFGGGTRNRAVGICDITGSMTGTMNNSLSPALAFTGNTAPADITLTATTGKTLVFKAIIDSFTIGCAVDGEATYSANFSVASTAASFAGGVTASW